MKTKDLTKLISCGNFEVFRINESSDGTFVLKKMEDDPTPSWQVLSHRKSVDEIMTDYHSSKGKDKYPLLCSHSFTTFDLVELCSRRFNVIKLSTNMQLMLLVFNSKTLKWEYNKEFNNVYDMNKFMNEILVDPMTILVDD